MIKASSTIFKVLEMYKSYWKQLQNKIAIHLTKLVFI